MNNNVPADRLPWQWQNRNVLELRSSNYFRANVFFYWFQNGVYEVLRARADGNHETIDTGIKEENEAIRRVFIYSEDFNPKQITAFKVLSPREPKTNPTYEPF